MHYFTIGVICDECINICFKTKTNNVDWFICFGVQLGLLPPEQANQANHIYWEPDRMCKSQMFWTWWEQV